MGDEAETTEKCEPLGGGCLLTTGQLLLRPPRRQDAGVVASIASNRKIAEQTRRLPYPYYLEDAQKWIDGMADADEYAFLITRKRDATVVGACGFGIADDGEHEIG